MPGHKLGKGIPIDFLSQIEKLDLTEIPGTDNLHSPSGIIKQAEELAAWAFGARESYFLVNGSTVGLHAAIAAVSKPGQQLIVGRDSHRAVINGMLLNNVNPYYILPDYSEEFGIYTGVSPQTIEKALQEASDAVAVLITRPSYYGICSDIREIARLVHASGKILIVDEAHGPHLVFNNRLPESALKAGADISIQSAHKTLPAFTQGAYLHTGSDRIDTERLKFYLDMYQTTSPSYIIMAYLDIAREMMQKNGKCLLDQLLDLIRLHGEELSHGSCRLLKAVDIPCFKLDSTRITINVSGLGITGYMAEKLLWEEFRIQVEMSDLRNIVCITTVADNAESIGYLFRALTLMKSNSKDHFQIRLPAFPELKPPEGSLVPSSILQAGIEKVKLSLAAGRISRNIISPYPPGMALVGPGERFTSETVSYLQEIILAGGIVHGIEEDGRVAVIR